jgi:hypothetical protein
VVDLRSNVYGNDEQVNDDRFNAPNANARKKKKKKKKGPCPKAKPMHIGINTSSAPSLMHAT